ncbi:hypothetical protein BHE90_014976 [Fusarium euwallaceae]|uniref:CHAT domain-containing protein n=1 Tax=Fusarium euwallaceae TaxID=1147111 RepID=A0A430L4G2_9HYPO|nr:hypothetical protein BHE90_014976 [Fusarium euwallaceae]
MMPDLTTIKPQSDYSHFYSFRQHKSGPNSFARLFDSCMEEYRRAPDVDEIDGTIGHLKDALEPGTCINVAQALLRLAAAYAEKHRRTGTTEDQYASAVILREASCAIPHDDAEKTAVLDLAATAHIELFAETRDLDDIFLALQLLENILCVGSETELRATALEYLGCFRQILPVTTLDKNILDEAIRNHEDSLDLTPTLTRDWERRCAQLVQASHRRFEVMREMEHLQAVIKHQELLLENLPHDHRDKIIHEAVYASNCCERAIQTGDQATLEGAIEISDSLLLRLPDDRPQRGFVLFHQARVYAAMHDITWDMAFLDIAVREFSDGLRRIPKDTPGRKGWVHHASKVAQTLYIKNKESESLEMVSSLVEEELEYLPDNWEGRGETLRLLATVGFYRCERNREAAVLAEAIRRFEELLAQMPSDDPSREDEESRLAFLHVMEKCSQGEFVPYAELMTAGDYMPILPKNASASLCERVCKDMLGNGLEGDVAIVKERIRSTEDELQNLLPDDPSQCMATITLGTSYAGLYDKTKDKHYLEMAIRWLKRGAQVKPTDDATRQMQLVNSHFAFLIEHMRKVVSSVKPDSELKLDADLEASVKEMKDCFGPIPGLLDSPALAYDFRYDMTGDEADLDQAIQLYNTSLSGTPEGSENKPRLLHSIGTCYFRKYMGRNALTDLTTAIRYLEQALDESPNDTNSLDYARRLNSLGMAYLFKFSRTQDLVDIAWAFRRLETAVRMCEAESKTSASFHADLACAYLGRHAAVGLLVDLDDAITTFQKSLQIAKLHGMAASGLLMNLAEAHDRRYELHGKDEDWKQQIQCLGDFLHEQSEEKDPRYRWKCFERLGQAYHGRFKKTGDRECLQKAIEYLEKAVADSRQNTDRSSHADEELFEIYASLEDWPRAFRSALAMISHLRLKIDWSLEHADKQWLLRRCAGLASGAAAVALRAGESPYTALRLLESGRGIMINSLLGLRSDVDELRRDHPKEAEQYLRLRNQVDSVKPGLSHPAAAWLPVHQPDYRHGAAQALEKTIQDIRTLPGFESFLQGPSEEDMKAAATEGPIIVINVSKYGCDAIIIKTDNLYPYSLSNVTMADIQHQAVDAANMSSRVLEWLWDEIAKPLLDKLDSLTTCPEGGSLPHVRWVTTGPLSRLPLHAAGYHLSSKDLGRTVIDRVISSYSVSLTALVQSRKSIQDQSKLEREPAVYRKPESVALIAMEELYNAPEEARQITNICRSMSISRPESSRQQVLEALKYCDIFHFASHGTSNDEDPSESSLKLTYPDRLTVSSLFEINLHKRRPFLAYLSACSTGEIKQDEFIDEGLHLISAFQIAGFHHVIGTLWEVRDETCLSAAASVYKSMHVDGMSHRSVAEALHYATRQLRDEWVVRDSESRGQVESQNREGKIEEKTGETRKGRFVEEGPLFWVPYVHYGM